MTRRFPAIDDLIAETTVLCERFARVTKGAAWITYDDPVAEGFVSTDPPSRRWPKPPRKPRP